MTTATLKNSTTTVDFNEQIAKLMTETDHSIGRELKLAVAIYNNPVEFKVQELGSAKPADYKSKALSTKAALLRMSEAFKLQSERHDAQVKTAKRNDDVGFKARSELQRIKAIMTAAISMFDRAVTIAYAWHLMSAVIVDVTDKLVTVKVHNALEIDGKTYAVGETFKMTRKDAYELGLTCAKAKGLRAVSKPTAKAGAGVDTKAGLSLATMAGEFAKQIGTLTADASREFKASASSPALFGAMVRKLFAHDGQILVAELVEALRSNEALTGVAIVTELKPARVRKPAIAA